MAEFEKKMFKKLTNDLKTGVLFTSAPCEGSLEGFMGGFKL